MDVQLHHAGVEIDNGRFLTVACARGTRVLCLAGELWITQDHDTRDHFVRACESFEIAVDGKVIVQAQRASRVLLLEPDTAPREGWLEGWLGSARIDGAPPSIARLHGA